MYILAKALQYCYHCLMITSWTEDSTGVLARAASQGKEIKDIQIRKELAKNLVIIYCKSQKFCQKAIRKLE